MDMSNSSRNSHMEGVTHPPLALGGKFFVEMQPELQDDLEMSYQACQNNLWSLLQLKPKKKHRKHYGTLTSRHSQ